VVVPVCDGVPEVVAVLVVVTVLVGVVVPVVVLVEVTDEVPDDVGVCDQEGDKEGIDPYPTSIEHWTLDVPLWIVDEKKYVPTPGTT
jgi:hypothetical protein